MGNNILPVIRFFRQADTIFPEVKVAKSIADLVRTIDDLW
jgi:hypothetical protein